MRPKDREALKDWEAYRINILRSTPVDLDETPAEKQKRINGLLGDPVAFSKYYFPHYCKAEFAPFHKRFFKKLIDNPRIFLTRAWARSHAKSVCAGILAPLFLMFVGSMKNMLLVSYNYDNAEDLLTPLRLELESNQRLLNDFGQQQSLARWESGNFVTSGGCSFRAIGSGQSPRGARNQEARPDYILVDDVDEDELLRNPKRVNDAWDWLMGALFGCFDIDGPGRFVVVGNIIAQDTLVLRASKVSDDHEQINILDNNGRPSWNERYTLEKCMYMIKKMGYRLAQREYFNNPINEGKVFKKAWIQYKAMPSLKEYRGRLLAYLDPGFKKSATADSKCLVLLGLWKGEIHVIKVFIGNASVEEMIDWCYAMKKYVESNGGAFNIKMEEVFLQSYLYKDFHRAAETKGFPVPVSGDTRKKPDKDARIEAQSGYFERGEWWFNEVEKESHHMKELVNQFLSFEKGANTKKDGPDACEGGVFLLTNDHSPANDNMSIGKRGTNKKRV